MRSVFVFVFLVAISCKKSDTPSTNQEADLSFTESFDDDALAKANGWSFVNKSMAEGTSSWRNPENTPFSPFKTTSVTNGYLWTDYNSTSTSGGTISNWAISPIIKFHNGDEISFYTRAQIFFYNDDSSDYINRLQFRINLNNTGDNVGAGSETGDFNQVLLDINPDYREFLFDAFTSGDPQVRLAYPHRWTKFTVTIKDLPSSTEGRFAFRYFLENGGPGGRGSSVGIDEVSYKQSR